MVAASLLTTLLFALAIAISAKPVLERKSPIKSAVTKYLNLAKYNVLERDMHRINFLRRRAGTLESRGDLDSDGTDTLTSMFGYAYLVTVRVGSPSKAYNLILDPGSSSTWVGAQSNNSYAITNTSYPTGNEISIKYNTASFNGTEYLDQVQIETLVIANQSIGSASSVTGFAPGVDGIMGIGPPDLTIGTLQPDNTTSVPTVTDSLFAAGTIPEHLVSVALLPFGNASNTELPVVGEITWGGTDSTKFINEITYTPITQTYPSSLYWGIEASVTYGSNNLLPPNASGVVDFGTARIMLSTDAYNKYVASTNAVFDQATGLLSINSTQFEQLQSLTFTVSDVEFILNPDSQISPVSLNTAIHGVSDKFYLMIGDGGNQQGMDFILGMAAMERFYVVFDSANKQVGLANTHFTNGTFNTQST